MPLTRFSFRNEGGALSCIWHFKTDKKCDAIKTGIKTKLGLGSTRVAAGLVAHAKNNIHLETFVLEYFISNHFVGIKIMQCRLL